MNETSDRDTHFAGFAELLIDELMSFQDTDDRPRARTVIARRAYDLAYHILASDAVPECFSPEMALSDVPDMTTWPDKERK